MVTRDELLTAPTGRYQGSGREEIGRILDEFATMTGRCRKHAMRMLRAGAGNFVGPDLAALRCQCAAHVVGAATGLYRQHACRQLLRARDHVALHAPLKNDAACLAEPSQTADRPAEIDPQQLNVHPIVLIALQPWLRADRGG